MPDVVAIRPRGPYSLALTARHASDATRVFRDGVLTSLVPTSAGVELTHARQRADGVVELSARSDEAIDRLRFVLAIDDDHAPFLREFDSDPLLGRALRQLRGLRVIRVPTVAAALLRALCGQLIESKRARSLERAIVRSTSARHGALCAPPTSESLASVAPARLRALGLHARRGATLVRICSSLDLERLRGVPVDRAADRLVRERGLGPWSAGVVALEGLGSYRYGLVGDLGLLKLFAALHGRWPDAGEDAQFLARYEPWQGLASVYLLLGFARGLVPLPAVAA
jgi:3-methyladenine DNA glycosylase/8-oxoguanine DNA glycosylase